MGRPTNGWQIAHKDAKTHRLVVDTPEGEISVTLKRSEMGFVNVHVVNVDGTVTSYSQRWTGEPVAMMRGDSQTANAKAFEPVHRELRQAETEMATPDPRR